MKILCDSCQHAPASLICCCAHEASSLCPTCDSRMHTTTNLPNKHQRLPLISTTPQNSVSCDICQEKRGYFFCLEDRALLCRNCDVSIHSSNALTSNHRRFLLTGVRVPLHALSTQDLQSVETPSQTQTQGTTQMGSSSPSQCSVQMHGLGHKPQTEASKFVPTSTFQEASVTAIMASSNVKPVRSPSPSIPSRNLKPVPSVSSRSLSPKAAATWMSVGMKKETESGHTKGIDGEGHGCKGTTLSDYFTEAMPGWGLDEIFAFTDTASGYNFVDYGSSKTDAANLWHLDWSADLNILEAQVCRGSFAEVPQTPSPPTATGLWRSSGGLIGTTKANIRPDVALLSGTAGFSLVPDVGGQLSPTSFPSHKRRKTFIQLT